MNARSILAVIVLLGIGVPSLEGLLGMQSPGSGQRFALRKTGVFNSPEDLFWIGKDYVVFYEEDMGVDKKTAVHKVGGEWRGVPADSIRTDQPVALGSCDPLNQVDISLQQSQFSDLPSVLNRNLKQVIQTDSYALLVTLARGSAVGGSGLNITLAIPRNSHWVELNSIPISSNAEFCVAQSINVDSQQRSVFVFFNEPAGSGDSFSVAAFDLRLINNLN